MQRTFVFEIPVTHITDIDTLISSLNAKLQRLTFLHPALRSVDLQAADGTLTMTLATEGRDQWMCQNHARVIASAMLRRVRLNTTTATLVRMETTPNHRSRTLAQGRNPSHTPRGKAKIV